MADGKPKQDLVVTRTFMTNAEQVIETLKSYRSPDELKKYERYFPLHRRGDDKFMGVRMGQVFEVAKANMDLPPDEVERLLESPFHEVRAAAVSVMDFQARRKQTSTERRQDLYELYLRRHDRINDWDLVDRSAPHVVGRWLADKPRDPLYRLAGSPSVWERRTAIVSTLYLIKQGEKDDAFRIAELLLRDPEEYIHKAVGWALRTAGGPELLRFLERHAAEMPRTALRYATEKLDKERRDDYAKRKR